MAGHTPGPWFYLDRNCLGGPAIVPAKGPAIAEWFDDGRRIDHEEHEANGRLAAAAPDLLAACEAIVACSRRWDAADGAWAEEYREAMVGASNAIARAKGGT